MNQPRILLLDDDRDVLSAFARIAGRLGYCVDSTLHLDSALWCLGRYLHSVIISDYWLQGINGFEALAALHQVNPQALCLLSSGDRTTADLKLPSFIRKVIPKPWDVTELRQTLAEIQGSYRLLPAYVSDSESAPVGKLKTARVP